MSAATPSPGLIAALDADLRRYAPLAQMQVAHRQRFLMAAEQTYHAPDEVVLNGSAGPVPALFLVRQGAVVGEPAAASAPRFSLDVGELFPIGALLAGRAVTSTYRAQGDTFCLRVPTAVVRELMQASAPFADFLQRRVLHLLALSQQAMQAQAASQVLSHQAWQSPLAEHCRRAPLTVPPDTSLRQALQLMHTGRIGSVLVGGDDGAVQGILTRHDVLDRVTLAGLALDTPIAAVMSQPVHTLTVSHRLHDAALLMSQQGLRHVPITDGGRVVGIVSERDLFALQRLSLRQLGDALAAADSVADLSRLAADIRRFAQQLLAQGVGARQITELISHLNDRLTQRLVTLKAQALKLDLRHACWLTFGSEGREEQTLATDQDNGLVFAEGSAGVERWLALGQAVNDALARCGYPLCSGGVMAGQPACCLSAPQWQAKFAQWIDQGAPQDLLNASIYFDLRPLAGDAQLAAPLQQFIQQRAAATPRFLKQLAMNALTRRPPLHWHGGLAGDAIDLKLQGTALLVEAARVLALAAGVAATSTRQRLERAAATLGVPGSEAQAWVAAFDHLQLWRLQAQTPAAAGDDRAPAQPNHVVISSLNEIDRRVLREAMRAVQRLQQRLTLDYAR
jgi:CBS domain-containing protein